MTENKRFVNENDGDIRDTSTMIIYYCLSLTGKELCDLLNALHEENEQLKKENERLKNWNKCLAEKRHNDGVTE